MDFKLISPYRPTGDQPEAIDELSRGILDGTPYQTLLGVTGSGKTFTMANVIERVQKPTLILSHNKTLAAQLYNEFKSFFPENAVEYFVSYYDYYQPEAYIPSTDTYIEKDLAINEEIDRLRLSTTSALLSGRKDVIVVSSVSCLYGIGNPEDFHSNVIDIKVGDNIGRNRLLRHFVDSLYSRNEIELNRGNFRVKGDTVDIYLAYDDVIVRIEFWGEEIESIRTIDPATGNSTGTFDAYKIFPANLFVTTKERIDKAIGEIEIDLGKQVEFFKSIGKNLEAKRLYERVTYDVEMIREIGHCSGIENYSRYFDGREAGTRPFCLLDYFPKDFLTIIDESHVTVPQIRAMYGGDRSRKMNLVEYGFRLPAAVDNRPLKFDEFEGLARQIIYVSATPADYELEKSEGIVVEQVIRPTGLLDPIIEVRPSLNQIDDLLEEIQLRIERDERVLVTTLTKRMAEELNAYLELSRGILDGTPYQTLLGVTGSGKTFTMANVIERVQKPTLILSHNKTLAAQLYNEFKSFFPENAVEYFVSYYDYYQPEAYIPSTDTYIEKDLAINEEIDRLRLSTTSALLSGRKDVIVVSSVSCLYGIGNPEDFHSNVIDIKVGDNIGRNRLLRHFVDSLYSRNEIELNRGNFRVKGDTVDIYLAYDDVIVRIEFWGEEIESIRTIDPATGNSTGTFDAYKIFPANLFVTTKERIDKAIGEIEIDLGKQVEFFKSIGKNLEAKRLYERVTYDVEMIREIGHCSGIENYSRYFDGREAGTRPFCLLDYFPKDFLTIIDESHVTVPQIRAMYGGDRSRKMNLVEYGFRLPAAVDNRPLKFDEFEGLARQIIYVSATPADYELEKSEGIVVEQVIRPTGLLDPIIEVRPSLNQIDDLLEEIQLRIERDERVLVTTLTKRMAEELNAYLAKLDINCNYIHSDVDTLDRIKILDDLRAGVYDVLIGVNLLREGLDLPEVSLVAILDADKEGFLRSHRSLTQTVGRAARNLNGRVIMYADRITESMQKTIDETNRRREKQLAYNEENHITPQAIQKSKSSVLVSNADTKQQAQPSKATKPTKAYSDEYREHVDVAADPIVKYMSKEQLQKAIERTRKQMVEAAKKMDFIEAAQYRDELIKLEDLYQKTTTTT